MVSRFTRVCCIAALAVALLGAEADPERQGPSRPTRGALIVLEGYIGLGNAEYLHRKLATARSHGAKLVIIEIHSGGGRVDMSMAMAEMLRDAYWAHTVAFIPHHAYSGAAVIALGCQDIVMGPEAIMGDAGEIFQDENSQFRYVPEKLLSPLIEFVHTLAAARGHPPALAEAMVDMKLTVYHVQNVKTGKMACMSQREIDAEPDQWRRLAPVPQTGGGRFFTVNGQEAVKLGLAKEMASSRAELAARYPLEGQLLVLEPSVIDTIVQILNSPWITSLLLVVGLIGLYIEFSSPGIGFGGLLAAVCFATFFWSHFLGNPAAWLALILFMLGMAFVAVELFVLPGFAVAGLAGAILMIAGVALAIQGFFIPQTPQDLATLTQTALVIFISGLTFAVAAVYISKRLGSLPLFSRLVLAPPEPAGAHAALSAGQDRAAAAPGRQAELPVGVGRIGIAQSTLRPGGKARFGNQYVDVITDGDFIVKGSRVRIVEISGNRVVVRGVDE